MGKSVPVLVLVMLALWISSMPIALGVSGGIYEYSCVGTHSQELIYDIGSHLISNNVTILCSNGCSVQQPLNCVEGRTPQCDYCIKPDVETSNIVFWLVVVVGNIILLVGLFFLYSRLDGIFLGFVHICFLVFTILIMFSYGLPEWFTKNQQIIVAWTLIIDLILTSFYSIYRLSGVNK